MKKFSLMSGGDHSMCATQYAIENDLTRQVVHIDTGIGVSDSKEFVLDTCSDMKVPLRVMGPPEGQYEALVLKYGFPGPGMHYMMYRMLKERVVRQLVRETKTHRLEEIGLITGVYGQESARRMGFVEPKRKVGSQVWLAPLHNWSPLAFSEYKRSRSLPTSPAKKVLGFSGECLCGSFATPNEITRIERHYPKVAARIHSLELKAKAAGKHCVWGVRPKSQTNQYDIPFMPMCSGCTSTSFGATCPAPEEPKP